ncbi:trypsin-like peptidase domain-containing protein [Kitasatospora sp. NPDC085464]|uniref:trypsin-like peptidase domain-containing protein n=1 Tax=Kitasatospora sp. NPDC085464 TaxID=3364063 RepID=UPI0037C70EED
MNGAAGRRFPASTGLDPDRAAEILVTTVDGRDERGSGYRVTSRSVLTAGHVVRDADDLRVRFRADQPGEWTVRGTVLWSHDRLDLAVVGLDDDEDRSAGPGAAVPPVRFGAVPALDGTVTCSSLGFPLFKLRRSVDGRGAFRDANHVTDGRAPAFSNRREGRLAVRVDQSPRLHGSFGDRSPWEGMSGAAVWSAGCVIGVVTDHHENEGTGELSAARVDRWYEALTREEVAFLHEAIGLPLTRDGLTEVRVDRSSADLEAVRQSRALHALLEAELNASPVHHYRLRDRPGLSLDDTYVYQRVEETVSSSDLKVSAPITADEVLTRHRHVVLEGQPGAGKSTFLHHVARRLARSWTTGEEDDEVLLDRTVLPLRVAPQDLAGPEPLPVLLRASAHRRLGGLLSSGLPVDLFEESVHAVRWLVLVDGLDEIVDVSARRRVLDVIAADVRRPVSSFRWIVATRPLPAAEVASLREDDVAVYRLAPFDDAQLRLLAGRWLDAEADEAAGEDRVNGFLRQIDAKGLRQIIRTPLLASIALMVYRDLPGGDLPVGRAGLYEDLIGYLFRRDAEGGRRSAWRRTVVEEGGDESLADRLYGLRAGMLTHLARMTLASDTAVTTADAVAWAKSRVPDPPDFFAAWAEAIGALLSGTGLFHGVAARGELHWAHRSLAEFLVARDAARALPDTWPGEDWQTDELLSAALAETRDELAVLTIACWAHERGDRAAERLAVLLMDRSDRYDDYTLYTSEVLFGLDGNTPDRYALLAGRLLADGLQLPEDLRIRIVHRLADRTPSHFHFGLFSDVLCALPDTGPAHRALEATLRDTSLSFNSRCETLPTLSRLSGVESMLSAASELLAQSPAGVETRVTRGGNVYLDRSDPRAVVASVLARVQDPPAQAMAAELAEQACDELGTAEDREAGSAATKGFLADAFTALGNPGRAVRLLQSERANEITVARLVAAGATSAAVAAVRELSADPDRLSISSIEVLVQAGVPDPVPEICADVLRALTEELRRELHEREGLDEWTANRRGREISQLLRLQLRAGDPALSLQVIRAVAGEPTEVDPVLALCVRAAPKEFADLLRCADRSGFHQAVRNHLPAMAADPDDPAVRLYASLVLFEIGGLPDPAPLLRTLLDRRTEADSRLDVVARLLSTRLRAEVDGVLAAMAAEDELGKDLALARLLLWTGQVDVAASVAERTVLASCDGESHALDRDAIGAVRMLATYDAGRCSEAVARLTRTMLDEFADDPESACRELFSLLEILPDGGPRTTGPDAVSEASAELIEHLSADGTASGFRAAVCATLALSAAARHDPRTRAAARRACEAAPWTQLDFRDDWLTVGTANAAAQVALAGDYAYMRRIVRRISTYQGCADLPDVQARVRAAVDGWVSSLPETSDGTEGTEAGTFGEASS